MAFEFFFGVFGLISSDSRERHKSRLASEWRMPAAPNGNLFREVGPRAPGFGATDAKPVFSLGNPFSGGKSSSGSDGLFSSASSSSASSIASSGSNLTSNSASPFVKPSEQPKKYEFLLNLTGDKTGAAAGASSGAGGGGSSSSSGIGSTAAANIKLVSDGLGLGGAGVGVDDPKLLQSTADLLSEEQPAGGERDAADGEGGAPSALSRAQWLRRIYNYLVCGCLWLQVFRLIVGLLVDKSLVTLDFYSLGSYKIHFLIPSLCLAIQAASVSLLFIRNNDETNWLVPFYSSKDYLIRSRSNFKPKMEDYTRRVNISVALALALALLSSISLSAYLVHCVGQSEINLQQEAAQAAAAQAAVGGAAGASGAGAGAGGAGAGAGTSAGPIGPAQTMPKSAPGLPASTRYETLNSGAFSGTSLEPAQANGSLAAPEAGAQPLRLEVNRLEQLVLGTLLALDIIWAVYSTYICFLVSFYFNLICSIMKKRFHTISKIIEDLAESNTTKTTNQARKITTLYLEHNEACELLDESNDFWQYLIFFTYFTYIPAYCYCLYNLFFVDFETWPSFVTWVIHTHTGFIILLISFSAAGVSTEAHAPYTSLHTLSLIQLPLDVEVNIATFLHRVRGLTIGYSCYDLFAITNASMSNTAAACASYFLIVADFSRSSVFTLAQMNGTAKGATPTTPTPAH